MPQNYWRPDIERDSATGQRNIEYLSTVTQLAQEYKAKTFDALDLEPGHRILDIGCGIGDDVRALAQRVGSTGRSVGLDPQPAMIEEARARSEGSDLPVEFVRGDAYDLPFDDDTFDATRSDRVFQHLEKPVEALTEMVRVTKPGGYVSLTDTDFDAVTFDMPDRELYRKVRHGLTDHESTNGFAGRSLYRQVRAAGLDVSAIDLFPSMITSLAYGDMVGGLSDWGQRAFDVGSVTKAEAESWRQTLKELDDEGQLFGYLVLVHVTGQKPTSV